MADRRAGDTVSTSGRFSDGIPDVEHSHLYELANTGSDRRDFSVARSIDVIAVVKVYVLFPQGGTNVPSQSDGCRAAIISHVCVVITNTELCSARITSASGSTLLI